MSFSHPRPKPTCLRQADESKFFALHEQALHLRGFMRSSVRLSFFPPVTVFACSPAAFVPLLSLSLSLSLRKNGSPIF